MPQNKDSLANTLIVAIVLSLVCSALVSAAAVILKPLRAANILHDKRTNILKVCGFSESDIKNAGGVEKLFKDRFQTFIVDLNTGEESLAGAQEAVKEVGKKFEDFLNDYDQLWCSKSKEPLVATELDKKADICGIKYRENFSHVFVLQNENDGSIEKYVFPVRSYGLWSMMQGYLAVEPDLQTVAGLTFYEQAETPGLGGEVTNPKWKAKWIGKQIFDQDGNVALKVAKALPENDPNGVDALTGATITSNGVSYLMEYWMGDAGFGSFIKKEKSGEGLQLTPVSDSQKESANQPEGSGENHG